MVDVNNVTTDTFSHTSNTQKENANTIFKSEKLDKLDDLADALEDLTTNDNKYYEWNTETASVSHGDITRNPETLTHTRNDKETIMYTNNGNFEQNYWVTGSSLLSSRQWTRELAK